MRRQPASRRVVDIDRRHLRDGSIEAGKKADKAAIGRLAVPIRFARLGTATGENRHIERQRTYPPLFQRQPAQFDHRLAATGIAHLRHEPVYFQGLRRGAGRGDGARTKGVMDGTDQSNAAIAVQKVFGQVRNAGLSAHPRYAD